MLSMSQALQRIKGTTAAFVDAPLLQVLCRQLQLGGRQRLLTPHTTTQLFLRQILEGNTSVPELRRLAKVSFADSSYCDAPNACPWPSSYGSTGPFSTAAAATPTRIPTHRWHGHRVFFLDGSSFSMPDTPDLRAAFGQSGQQAEGCGFPTAHLLVQFHAYTGYVAFNTMPAPLRTHDLADLTWTHRGVQAGDVVAGDPCFLLLRSSGDAA